MSNHNSDNQRALVLPCSGAGDTGEISDLAARKLTREDIASMFCLAGIGANIDSFVAVANKAEEILVIDGCPLKCASKTLERHKISKFKSFIVTDLGLKKGSIEINDKNINLICNSTFPHEFTTQSTLFTK